MLLSVEQARKIQEGLTNLTDEQVEQDLAMMEDLADLAYKLWQKHKSKAGSKIPNGLLSGE